MRTGELVGNANGANELKFGTKIDIKNNLIFVLAPEFDMSQLSGYFKDTNYSPVMLPIILGVERVECIIYSLDGELLLFSVPLILDLEILQIIQNCLVLMIFLLMASIYICLIIVQKNWCDLNEHYVAGTLGVSEANETAAVGYSISAGAISKNTWVMHLKLPESITKYYDDISKCIDTKKEIN